MERGPRNRLPSFWPWVVAAAGYAGIVVLMLAPVTNFREFSTAIAPGDPRLLAWTFAWTSHALLAGKPLFDANIFYPTQHALGFAEHHIGVGIWGLPLYVLTGNAVVVYGALKISALTLNAVSMHVFVWRWLRSHGPAVIAGLIFGVSSTRLLYSGHVPLVWNCWLPLILLALERWAATRQWRWMMATAAVVSVQSLATWYLAVMAVLAVVLFGIWRSLWTGLRLKERDGPASLPASPARRLRSLPLLLVQAAAAAVLVAALVWPFARPYAALAGREEARPEIALRYSADLGSYVQPPEGGLLAPLFTRLTGLAPRRVVGERAQFLGFAAMALAVIGVFRFARLIIRRSPGGRGGVDLLWTGYFLLLAVVAVALSLGPSADGTPRMPFDLISRAPVLGMFRVPSRFAVLVTLAVSGLAAAGVDQLRNLRRRAAGLVGVLLAPVMLMEWAIAPPAGSKPAPDPTPAIYRMVAQLDVHALVSLPCYRRTGPTSALDADYLLYSTVHWKPIVNGYGRAEPPNQHWIVGAVNAFPGRNSAIRMRELGIDYVVVHAARYPDRAVAILEEARASDDFQLVAQVADDYLFRVLPAR